MHKKGLDGIYKNFSRIQARGPDRSQFRIYQSNDQETVIGFHRLAINDLTPSGDQPFVILNSSGQTISLICNGEIYNCKQLAERYNIKLNTSSDCEIILHMFLLFGFNRTLMELDGVFALVLQIDNITYLARDPIGVRPLFFRYNNSACAIASQAIALEGFTIGGTRQVPPGSYFKINMEGCDFVKWYHMPRGFINESDEELSRKIKTTLTRATCKRLLSQRPIGCLLSGGLDSSIIASLLSSFARQAGKTVKTFSIGFTEDSTDLIAAQKVANFIKSDHQNIVIKMSEAFRAIPEVIQKIESFDITTVRASVGMFLISKWIKEHTNIRVLMSGEGSDELFAGYLYFHEAPTVEDLEKDSERLLKELPFFDVLRADRSTAMNGLELRVPFLDKSVVKLAMTIPGEQRHPKNKMEKKLLRDAFQNFIPEEILWRRKEGFSDGVSNTKNSWFGFIQERVEELISDDEVEEYKNRSFMKPITKEAIYYHKLYREHFQDYKTPVPHHWMPKWQETDDPSGRVMPAFSKK